MRKKILIVAALFSVLLIGYALTSFVVQSECYRLNDPWVDNGCTPMYPCDSKVECGQYRCCFFARPGQGGYEVCVEGESTTYPYVERLNPDCGRIPCAYLGGGNTYCIGGTYYRPAGFTDWVAADLLAGTPCTGE